MVCLAAATACSGILETVRQKYDKATSLSSDMSLTIRWKVREKEESRSGRIYLTKGDKFRVELGETIWVSNGQTMWQYSKQTNQVIVKRILDVDLSSHPSQILSTFLNDYDYAVLEDNGRQVVLQWVADSTDKTSFYRQVTAYYDTKKGYVSSFLLVDKHANESVYLFKRTEFSEQIPRELFEFEPPKGAHVLDERH
jgi:chaperone LolA